MTQAATMTEQVAKAIARARHGYDAWERLNEVDVRDFMQQAEAAITASRLSPAPDTGLIEALSGATLSLTSYDGHCVRLDFASRDEAEQATSVLEALASRPNQATKGDGL